MHVETLTFTMQSTNFKTQVTITSNDKVSQMSYLVVLIKQELLPLRHTYHLQDTHLHFLMSTVCCGLEAVWVQCLAQGLLSWHIQHQPLSSQQLKARARVTEGSDMQLSILSGQ